MVGYFGRNAYRLYNPATWQILRSRDVLFEEGSNHKTMPNQPTDEETDEALPEEPVVTPVPPEPTPTASTTTPSDPLIHRSTRT